MISVLRQPKSIPAVSFRALFKVRDRQGSSHTFILLYLFYCSAISKQAQMSRKQGWERMWQFCFPRSQEEFLCVLGLGFISPGFRWPHHGCLLKDRSWLMKAPLVERRAHFCSMSHLILSEPFWTVREASLPVFWGELQQGHGLAVLVGWDKRLRGNDRLLFVVLWLQNHRSGLLGTAGLRELYFSTPR